MTTFETKSLKSVLFFFFSAYSPNFTHGDGSFTTIDLKQGVSGFPTWVSNLALTILGSVLF